VHSFAMSANYIIIIEQPSVISLSKILASSVKGYAMKDWVDWRPEEKNRFIICTKSGKHVKTEFISAESFFFMHVVNCYEVDDQIIVDVNGYEAPTVMETLLIPKLRKGIFEDCDHPYVQRFVIPLADASKATENENLVKISNCKSTAVRKGNQIILTPEILTDIRGAELQSLNRKCFGKKYTYFYTAGTYNPSHYSHAICKVNVDTKESVMWKENEYNYPGEPYFVANPEGTDEDDGVVISAVADCRKEHKDFLLILDAKTLTELGRATFDDVTIPSSLHGIFIPSA